MFELARPTEPAAFAPEQRAIAAVQPLELSAMLAEFAPTHRPPRKPPSQQSNATRVSPAFAELALRLHSQEITDHLMTALGQH